MREEQKMAIVSCLKEQSETKKTCQELKQFYDKFGFVGFYTLNDSYIDYFQSTEYISNQVNKWVSDDNYLDFDKKIKENIGIAIYDKYKEAILGRFTSDDEVRFIFRELDGIDYSKFMTMKVVIKNRVDEMKKCYKIQAYLSVIILAGSILEALLISLYPKKKDEDFKALIDTAKNVALFNDFAYQKAENIRNYRNYIHPLVENDNADFQPTKTNAESFIKDLAAILEVINFT